MLLLQGRIAPTPPPKKNMTLCVIGRVKGEGIVVKFTAAIFFLYGGLISTQSGRITG